MTAALVRCPWPGADPTMLAYHDLEWGVPLVQDEALFGNLLLSGAQAGLSWKTVLLRREGYRRAFAGFDPQAIAQFGEADEARLLADPGIIRNRQKIRSAIQNARAVMRLRETHGSFAAWLWRLLDAPPVQNAWLEPAQLPARSALSDRISRVMLAEGFSFAGTTIIYAWLQSVGGINDHLVSCFRYQPVAQLQLSCPLIPGPAAVPPGRSQS